MRTVPPSPVVAPFAEPLLRHDLPGLPERRRRDVVEFQLRRLRGLPAPMRLGVGLVAVATRLLVAVAGGERSARWLGSVSLPGTGEYVRLLRSLAFAYVWETWPDTRVDGSPR
jgi:hypothetical protein